MKMILRIYEFDRQVSPLSELHTEVQHAYNMHTKKLKVNPWVILKFKGCWNHNERKELS